MRTLELICNIIGVEEKTSKKGNKYSVLRALSTTGKLKEFLANPEELLEKGFKPTMVSDLQKGKVVNVTIEVDPFSEPMRITSFKPAN